MSGAENRVNKSSCLLGVVTDSAMRNSTFVFDLCDAHKSFVSSLCGLRGTFNFTSEESQRS